MDSRMKMEKNGGITMTCGCSLLDSILIGVIRGFFRHRSVLATRDLSSVSSLRADKLKICRGDKASKRLDFTHYKSHPQRKKN